MPKGVGYRQGGPKNIKGKGSARSPLPPPKGGVKTGPKPRETGRPKFTKRGKG